MHPPCLLLLILAVAVVSLDAAPGTPDDPFAIFNYTCSASENYTDGSPYAKNLDELLSTLSPIMTPGPVDNWWFRHGTVGQASGLAMCYADSEPSRCLNCLNNLLPESFRLWTMCNRSRDVSYISNEGCVIRYAGAPFFGSAADSGAGLVILRSYTQPEDAPSMREARRALLSQLAENAGGDDRRFAMGSREYMDTVLRLRQVMYGMAQCTRDLPPSECTSCLIDNLAVMYREVSVTESTKASVMGFSCYLRYQVNQPIHIAGMAEPPVAPPTAEPPTTGSSAPPSPVGKTPLIAALAAVASAITLFFVGV